MSLSVCFWPDRLPPPGVAQGQLGLVPTLSLVWGWGSPALSPCSSRSSIEKHRTATWLPPHATLFLFFSPFSKLVSRHQIQLGGVCIN